MSKNYGGVRGVYTFTYNGDNKVVKKHDKKYDISTTTERITTYEYDAAGRMIKRISEGAALTYYYTGGKFSPDSIIGTTISTGKIESRAYYTYDDRSSPMNTLPEILVYIDPYSEYIYRANNIVTEKIYTTSLLAVEEEFTCSYDTQGRITEKKSNGNYNLYYNYK